MRQRLHRHLFSGSAQPEVADGFTRLSVGSEPGPPEKPAEMTWRDYLVMLLHVGAEIEHSLMAEYLYAAYSLGGPQVPVKYRKMVRRWQDNLLIIAREEMGHLMSVQNLLCLLGGPISFEREDYPWDSPFYPFSFHLRPLSLDSLAHYVYAEMPEELEAGAPAWQHELTADVRKTVEGENRHPHPVGKIYHKILELLADRERIPDSAFLPGTVPYQASWDDWGKGHSPKPHPQGVPPDENAGPSTLDGRVIVATMATRTEAIDAAREVAGQGEAPHLRGVRANDPSHFDRFIEIYRELSHVAGEFRPARELPDDPATVDWGLPGFRPTLIEAESTRKWASLFNLRYRMLLSYLTRAYHHPRVAPSDAPSLRGSIMHRAFAEMYNVKTISGILMRLPLREPSDGMCAGPPFQMPYTVVLPASDADGWRLNIDLLTASIDLCGELLNEGGPGAAKTTDGRHFLKALRDIDQTTRVWMEDVLAGLRTSGGSCR